MRISKFQGRLTQLAMAILWVALTSSMASCGTLQEELPGFALPSLSNSLETTSSTGPSARVSRGLSIVTSLSPKPREGTNPQELSLTFETPLLVGNAWYFFFQGQASVESTGITMVLEGETKTFQGPDLQSNQGSLGLNHVIPLSPGASLESITITFAGSGELWVQTWGILAQPQFSLGGPGASSLLEEANKPPVLAVVDGSPTQEAWGQVFTLVPGRGRLALSLPPLGGDQYVDLVLSRPGNTYRWRVPGSQWSRTIWPGLPDDPTAWTGGGTLRVGPSPGLDPQVLQGITYTYHELQPHPQAITTDFESMLARGPRLWRNPRYEVYAWSVYPSAKVLAFADYATQSRYLGRLAFYVEKVGFRGSILSESAIAGRHDYNAHNYSALGLASFFTKAQVENIPLRPEEAELKDLVLSWNIIVPDASTGGFSPGEGGILSFSFDPKSWDGVRRLLLGHELLHGFFYKLPELRTLSALLWDSLRPETRSFITDYFLYIGYDPADSYLMHNEFQAYLLQQTAQSLETLVGSQWYSRITSKFPEKAEFYRSLIPQIRNDMLLARQALTAVIQRDTGLVAPNLSEFQSIP